KSHSFALLRPRVFACRIGPTHRRWEDDLHLAADCMAHAGAELERLQPAAKHRELVDGLRTLIALTGDARGEPIVGLRLPMLAKPNVLGPNRDLDRLAAPYVGRHHRRESMAAGLDDAVLAVALEDAARDQA